MRDILAPRLRAVVDGTDMGGITGSTGWSGGGAFEVVLVRPRVDAESYGRELESAFV